jgi:hypothetical protein
MNRRGFFSTIAACALVATADMTRLGRTLKDVMPKAPPLGVTLWTDALFAEAFTLAKLDRLMQIMKASDEELQPFVIVRPRMASEAREHFGLSVKVIEQRKVLM